MSVKANKCVYYENADTIKYTCHKYDVPKTCSILLGGKCNMYYSKYQQNNDLKESMKIETNEARKILANYKKKNDLSFFDLGLMIETSYTTVRSFLIGRKIKYENQYKINKFVRGIK